MRHPFPRGWRPFINVQWKNRKLATRLWLVASSQIQRMMTLGSVDDHILFPPPFDRSLISPRRGWLSLESFHELLRALFFSLLLHFRTSFVGIFFLLFDYIFFDLLSFLLNFEDLMLAVLRAVLIYICYIEGICLFDYIYQQRGFSFVFFFLKENCSNFKLEGMLKPSHTISTLVPDK